MCFLATFLFGWSIHRCEWGIKVSHYYLTVIKLLLIFPFILVSICLTYAPMLGAYIFIIVISSWIDPFDHYLESFFVSFHGLYFKVYSIWYEYCCFCFLLISIWMKYFFSSLLPSVCMCPFDWGGSLLDSIYRDLACVSIQPIFVFCLGHSTHSHLR